MSWNDILSNEVGEKTAYTKFEEGKATVIRIMDDAPVSKWRHWLPLAKRSVTCLGKDCPVCAVNKTAKETGGDSVYSNTKKHTITVLNKTTGQIELLEQGKTFFEQLLVYKENMGDLRTFDIKVIRTGKEKQTSYSFIPMPVAPLKDDEQAMYEANKYDIEDLLKPYTVEQTEGLMQGKDAKEVFGNTNLSKEGDEKIEV